MNGYTVSLSETQRLENEINSCLGQLDGEPEGTPKFIYWGVRLFDACINLEKLSCNPNTEAGMKLIERWANRQNALPIEERAMAYQLDFEAKDERRTLEDARI